MNGLAFLHLHLHHYRHRNRHRYRHHHLLPQLCVHTQVPSLESLHQRCPVNTRQKHSSQDHSFQNAHDGSKQSSNYVEEEKEVGYNGK